MWNKGVHGSPFAAPSFSHQKSPRDTPFHPRCIRMKQAAKCTCFSCFFLYIFSWNVMSFHYVRPTLYKGHKLSCLGSSDSSNTKQVQTKSVCSLPYKSLVLYLESGIFKWCSRSLFLNLVVINFCILVELRDCPRFGLSGFGRTIPNTTLNYPFFLPFDFA